MDTPKRQVSWLESFPPDIWAYLSWYLPGEQLERLLMTGAALLMQRLMSHHTVKSIKLGQDFMIFKSLVRLFNDFPYVDELYIHSITYVWSDKLGMTIDSMPLGLRKLELSGKWKKPADELFDKYGTTLKLNEHLPRLEVLDMMSLSCTSFTWMAHSPQSLTKLSLRRWDGSVELPTSLIHFEATDVTLSTSSFVSKLPPSLETFNVQDLKGVELLVPLLPTSTRKLCLSWSMTYSNGPRTSWNLLEQLPKSLTWLEVPNTTEIKFTTNPELVSHLPSTLTELHIDSCLPCSGWRLLPQQLTKLSFKADQSSSTVPSKTVDSHGVHHEVDSIPFDYFPRSITSLRLVGGKFFCGPPTTCDGSYFPPQLTHLDISDIQLSPETAKLLPSSLTFLVIRNLCERVCEHLPNTIKTLSSSSTLLTPNLIKFLPKSLTSLHLRVPLSDDIWYDYNTGRKMDSVQQHPQYSIQKDCLSPSFDWKDHSPLPSTLTKLHIYYAHELGDTFLQHQQLPNLTELNLRDSKHLTDLSIHHLPQHLTYLNLESSSNVSGKSFKFLPRGLTYLNLSNSESIFDCDIEHLPRTLKRAYLNHAIHLSDICIPDLPPHLEWLYMKFNSQISTSCFPKLPYSLRSPQISQSVEFANWEVYSGVLKVKNSTSAK